MSEIVDVYVLCDRNQSLFGKFLREFVKDADPCQSEYAFPRFSDNPEFITSSMQKVIDTLFIRTAEEYAFYWSPIIPHEEGIHSIMAFFTNDNHLIVGLTVLLEWKDHYVNLLKSAMNSNDAGMAVEMPPPLNAREFRAVFSCGN